MRGVGTVLDLGADHGEYAARLRRHRYVGLIRSFATGAARLAALTDRARHDDRWHVRAAAAATPLDAITNDIPLNFAVRLDVRGREDPVLDGGALTLARASVLDLVIRCDGDPRAPEVLDRVFTHGYVLALAGFDRDGDAIAFNGLFVRD